MVYWLFFLINTNIVIEKNVILIKKNYSLLIYYNLGQLAVSRSLGDFVYKSNAGIPSEEQTVTANPDIIMRNIAEDDEFIVLACDGNKNLYN